jgi:hypothetical protein
VAKISRTAIYAKVCGERASPSTWSDEIGARSKAKTNSPQGLKGVRFGYGNHSTERIMNR